VGAALVALVVYLSLTPPPIDAGRFEGVKTGHVLAYAVLMLWFAQLLAAGWARAATGLAFVAMGVGLEFAQGLTGYRTFAVSDMVDNAIGVAAGLVLAWTPLGGALGAFERRFA